MSKSYEIVTYTTNCKDAGTDADVYVKLYGSKGNTGKIFLDNEEDNFERGKIDRFTEEVEDIGELQRIRVGHGSEGNKPGWHLTKIIVTDNQLNKEWVFPHNDWIAKDEPPGLEVLLYPA